MKLVYNKLDVGNAKYFSIMRNLQALRNSGIYLVYRKDRTDLVQVRALGAKQGNLHDKNP